MKSVEPLEIYGFNEVARITNDRLLKETNSQKHITRKTILKHIHKHLMADGYATYAIESDTAYDLLNRWFTVLSYRPYIWHISKSQKREHGSLFENADAFLEDMDYVIQKFTTERMDVRRNLLGKAALVFKAEEEIHLQELAKSAKKSDELLKIIPKRKITDHKKKEFWKSNGKETIPENTTDFVSPASLYVALHPPFDRLMHLVEERKKICEEKLKARNMKRVKAKR